MDPGALDGEAFAERIADELFALDGIEAVALGGSRAAGTHRPDSDWDFGLYYRGAFDTEQIRGLGYDGQVFALGAWGGGIFNGGAWLTVDDHKVDIIYRDLEMVERELVEAEAGRFHREALLFHIAGIPSYLVVAELAINRVLRGALPRPEYPEALRRSAPPVWRMTADMLIDYLRTNVVPRGQLSECAALLTCAAICVGHEVLAARGEWCVNEKRLLDRAGLRAIDEIIARLRPDPQALARSVNDVAQLCRIAREAR
ncbi:nucleotidyltransferase domain-containing protein [Aldersonia sp. NBC_00410]|uniref:nucleotidyltransferase domain-containing protein n=1 Tax=Aldersonia sp. NBC_00410 TaxID=2975954 RepID=UPI002258BCB8|nr:nucleotidyltransferase domain-containing protein [Aldersonia sp. NBC_00410]MCX5046092.1 nucleotidyltransferase domain-containing protein [Aldersonia sp. NBC_00410]